MYTHNRKLRTKLSKIAEHNKDCQIIKETEDYAEFLVPKKWPKVSPTREMSEENKIKARERAKKMAEVRWGDKE